MSEPIAVQAVWYVAYGSNLALDRFRCYLRGGRPSGGMREYPGCRDARDPASTIPLHVSGGLVFAGDSTVWGGGMAFLDPMAPGRVACRAYLISAEQFADVTAQEMRRPAGGEFARELADMLTEVESLHTMGPGRYETIVRLGVREGGPLLTVTHGEVADLVPAAPSAAYLSQICTGLVEAHLWGAERIAAYLAPVPGVRPAWTAPQIAGVARAAQEAAQRPSSRGSPDERGRATLETRSDVVGSEWSMESSSSASARAFLEELRKRRAELRESMSAVEGALAAPATSGQARWAQHVHVALVELSGDFRQHIDITEGPHGLYRDLLKASPRLSGAVARLTREHVQITAQIDKLVARLSAPDVVEDVDTVRGQGTALLGRLVRHRQRGSDLVFDAYQFDIGGET